MSRSVGWRRTVSDVCSWRQDEALNATIYILREVGPTGFLLKEDGEAKKFKVYLGDPHTCTCPEFKKDRDLCKHICWVILRKFRVPRQNPVTWQLGLVEREINEILRGIAARQEQRPSANAKKISNQAKDQEESGSVKQREISEEDVCPICQEELLEKRLPVTYCRNGCGNNIHIKCMKVWAEHQKSQGSENIKCPMCREDFGPLSLLKQEVRNSSVRETRAVRVNEHLGTTCKKCYMCPIQGKCYRCSVCADYHLCQACFNTPTHQHHNFLYREKASHRWHDAVRAGSAVLPEAVVQNLMSRDLGEQDYDLLLQLDSVQQEHQASDLTEDTLRLFVSERVRQNSPLLAPGQQCRICLRPYQQGEYVKRLLCHHKFHRECIDNWLLHRRPTCPVDGTVYTNDSVRQIAQANRQRQNRAQEEVRNGRLHPENMAPDTLEIPGIGLASLGNSRVLDRHMNGLLEVAGIGGSVGDGQTRLSNGVTDANQQNHGTQLHGQHALHQRVITGRNASHEAARRTRQAARTADLGVDDFSVPLAHHGVLNSHGMIPLGRIGSSSSTEQPANQISSAGAPTPHHEFGSRPPEHPTSNASPALHQGGSTRHMNFSNLIMADIQRTLSRQSQNNDSSPQSVDESGRTASAGNNERAGSGVRVASAETQGNKRSKKTSLRRKAGDSASAWVEGSANPTTSQHGEGGRQTQHMTLSIGSLTQEAEQILERKRRLKKGRSQSLVQRKAGASTVEQKSTVNLQMNGVACEREPTTETNAPHGAPSTTASALPRAPVPPSIPLPRTDLSLGVGELGAGKPPAGATPDNKVKPSRLRARMTNNLRREMDRVNSAGRDRMMGLEQRLYVGSDPSSIAGFTSDFETRANQPSVQPSGTKHRHDQQPEPTEANHRWGTSLNLTGSDIMLAGTNITN